MTRLRVLTLNLWGRNGDWERRRDVLRRGIGRLRPDLATFQEAVVADGYDQLVEILGGGYRLAHQRARATDGTGISIASRWPITAVHELDFHDGDGQRDFPAGALAAEIGLPDGSPVLIVNHFPAWRPDAEAARCRQAVATAASIESILGGRDLPVVVAGDLDADPDSASVRFWTGREPLDGRSVSYLDAWAQRHPGDPGETFSPRNPLMTDGVAGDIAAWPFGRIDYVLVRMREHGSSVSIRDARLAFDEPVDGVWASDHFGVVADLGDDP